MDHTAPWTCPTCSVIVTTPFCAGCGEEPLPPRGLTITITGGLPDGFDIDAKPADPPGRDLREQAKIFGKSRKAAPKPSPEAPPASSAAAGDAGEPKLAPRRPRPPNRASGPPRPFCRGWRSRAASSLA